MRSPSATAQRFRQGTLEVEAMLRDGSLAQDLNIADWMARSTPHGEYRGNSAGFAIVTPTGLLPVGINDWIVRGRDGRFYPCSEPDELVDPAKEEINGRILEGPDLGIGCPTPAPAQISAWVPPTDASQRASKSTTSPAATCSGCDASASELAGWTMKGLAQDLVLSKAGLRRRAAGDLLCEECWRSLMHQP